MSLVRSSLLGMLLIPVIACSEPARRKLGATCSDSDQCASGLCYEGRCVDPEGDEDADGLWNALEVALGSDGLLADTDGDHILDPDELGADRALVDSDGDGKADILESAIADSDRDCINDQFDSDDANAAPGHCAVATPFVAIGTGGRAVATSRYHATLVLGSPALSAGNTDKHRALIGANPGLTSHSETP